jgi:hypothetical protein
LPKNTDTTLALFSDIHSGSPLGLMRPKQWQLKNLNVTPSPLQRLIWQQYDEAAAEIGALRKGKRLISIFNGDASEGTDHHKNKQYITAYSKEEAAIAQDAIDHGLTTMRHKKDDLFYMVSGTDSHVGEVEEMIAEDLPVKPYSEARNCWPFLPLKVNGVLLFIAHHGPTPGKGANVGNSLRNELRNIYIKRKIGGKEIPRFVIFGHYHSKTHVQYEYDGDVIDGFILPSFQAKTDYVYTIDPFSLTNIGMLSMNITAAGESSWRWHTMEVEYQDRIEIV